MFTANNIYVVLDRGLLNLYDIQVFEFEWDSLRKRCMAHRTTYTEIPKRTVSAPWSQLGRYLMYEDRKVDAPQKKLSHKRATTAFRELMGLIAVTDCNLQRPDFIYILDQLTAKPRHVGCAAVQVSPGPN